MSKFKVGDHVVDSNGEKGVVANVRGTSIQLRWDNGVEGGVFWEDHDFSLVQSGPVRTETVTRRTIVPGVYGRLRVGDRYGTGVWVEVTEGKGGSLALTATELDDLALVASQLAEALRDGQ